MASSSASEMWARLLDACVRLIVRRAGELLGKGSRGSDMSKSVCRFATRLLIPKSSGSNHISTAESSVLSCGLCVVGVDSGSLVTLASSGDVLRIRDWLRLHSYSFDYRARLHIHVELRMPRFMCPCVT
jgi:hypothetical protein